MSVAVIDYGLGNLLSVKLACEHVGLEARITSDVSEILRSDAIVLPGVGAFGDAMSSIRRLGLVSAIKDFVLTKKPVMGICLGMQLLMTQSEEFGIHEGLNVVEGEVIRLRPAADGRLKLPHLGWNRIRVIERAEFGASALLHRQQTGQFMYFNHSFHVVPKNRDQVVCVTTYGADEFCSGLRSENVWAFQFHPERSGCAGLELYRRFARSISESVKESVCEKGQESASGVR